MDPIITREEDLHGYFETGSKPRERWGIGLEYERAGVFRDSGRAVPYEGPASVETILNTLAKNAGWAPILESGRVLGLSKGGTRITLEPGAQMELSGTVHRGLHTLRTAMGLSPLLTALYANSPILEGRLTGFMTYRAWAWRDTDPDRCGLLPFVFKDGAGFRDYLEYALDVPMFFVVRGEYYRPAGGMTFRKFIKKGFDGERPNLDDWELHLSTLFPEVRLKKYIEVRGADSGEPASCLALAALLKGILYDGASRRAAWELVRDMTFKERERLLDDVCRSGPAARVPAQGPGRGEGAGAVPVRGLLIELVRLARQGLNNQGSPEESEYLALLDRRLGGEGGCPAARLAADWEGPMSRNPLKLVEALAQTQVEVA